MNESAVTINVPNEKLADAIKALAKEKRSGQLRVNFSQGTPTGGVQWIETVPNGKTIFAVD